MVRLISRSFLHLTPEVVQFEAELPFYAKVLHLAADEVTFRSLEGVEGTIDRGNAEKRVVLASEVTHSGRVSLLRRPVSVKLEGEVHYGQVVAVDNNQRSVRSGDRQLSTVTSAVSVAPPVVALLLEDAAFQSDEWSASDLAIVEQIILRRVLGRDGEATSNDVSIILDGVTSEESHPEGNKECQWIDPTLGEATRFPLQHAVDYAYNVDEGVSPVPQSVGSSFCRTPTSMPLSSTSEVSLGSGRDVQELFDPYTDDDESPPDVQERDGDVRNTGVTAAPGTKRSHEVAATTVTGSFNPVKRQCYRDALDQDAQILAKLGDEPELLERFLSIRKEAKAPVLPATQLDSSAAVSTIEQKTSSAKKAKTASKYAFAPSEDQVLVHERVTSEKHNDKSANAFCRSMVRSDHVEFKALPGVCTRTYDIRFGSGGLSIRQFARLSRDERVSWLAAGGSNFDNLSATAEFSAALPATRIEDVVDSARVFLTYSREFCCAKLTELVENIVTFIEHTLAQVSWASKELSSLVYWVNDVLEDFRCAADAGRDLQSILQRCTTDESIAEGRDVCQSTSPSGGCSTRHITADYPVGPPSRFRLSAPK
jgi:hypothetical protein